MPTTDVLFVILVWSLQGVGAKTARQLVQAFGPVEQVCQQLAAMPEDKQKQVRAMQPAAHMRYATYPLSKDGVLPCTVVAGSGPVVG